MPLTISSTQRCLTHASNWVIDGKLIQGAYPGDRDPTLHQSIILSLLAAGLTTFVSLLESHEQNRFEPNMPIILELYPKTRFINLEIPDYGITDDERILRLAQQIVDDLRSTEEVFYIHCWGGHGRSGTLVALILTLLGVCSEDALEHVSVCHRKRKHNGNIASPQTWEQIEQVRRLATREVVVLDEDS